MDSKKWIGTYYVGEDGAWIDGYKNEDGSVGAGKGNGAGKTVVIDPGHSSVVASGTEPLGPGSSVTKAKDSGGTKGVSTGIYEYQLTMTMAEKLKTELESRGYNVILTRSDNNTPMSCKDRAEVANNKAPALPSSSHVLRPLSGLSQPFLLSCLPFSSNHIKLR